MQISQFRYSGQHERPSYPCTYCTHSLTQKYAAGSFQDSRTVVECFQAQPKGKPYLGYGHVIYEMKVNEVSIYLIVCGTFKGDTVNKIALSLAAEIICILCHCGIFLLLQKACDSANCCNKLCHMMQM